MINLIDGYKKIFAATLASVLALVGLMNGLTVPEVAVVVGPLTGYVLSQGLADIGKERAKVEAQNGKTQ